MKKPDKMHWLRETRKLEFCFSVRRVLNVLQNNSLHY